MAQDYLKIEDQMSSILAKIQNFNQQETAPLLNYIKGHPFLYTYLRDVVKQIEKELIQNQNIKQWIEVIQKRMDYFRHWNLENNQTIDLILKAEISPDEIKPHIRHSNQEYHKFYQKQNEKVGQRVHKHKAPFSRFKNSNPLVLNGHYDHCIRKTHAVNVIETHMSILEKMGIDINKKWLDIGCGNGLIVNGVNPHKHMASDWKMFGCDLQENKIKIAQRRACKNRQFFQENVLDNLAENKSLKSQYDIISMFEFCEHFEDPMALLTDISKHQFKLVVIATPLNQKMNAIKDQTPDPVHLWSFDASAMIKMLEKLNLKIIYDSKINVGRHTKGLNWLTVVACKKEFYELFKTY